MIIDYKFDLIESFWFISPFRGFNDEDDWKPQTNYYVTHFIRKADIPTPSFTPTQTITFPP